MQLSLRDVVFEVFEFLWSNRTDLLRMMAAPVLALSILGLVVTAMVQSDPAPATLADLSALQILGLFLRIALSTGFYVMFAVAWHRRCLRPEEQTTILSALRWDRRKSLFLGRFVAIFLIAVALSIPPALVVTIVGGGAAMGLAAGGAAGPTSGKMLLFLLQAAISIVIFLVQARLALWLPPAAIDQKMTLMDAWVIGRRNSWRLVGIFLFSVAPPMLVIVLLGSALTVIGHATGLIDTLTFRFVSSLALNFVYYIVVAASVSALSISYRELRRTPSRGMPFQM